MKKATRSLLLANLIIVQSLFFLNFSVFCQETSKVSSSLPDYINKIVTGSCMPCHSSKGGLMSRSKLNFTGWAQYSPLKQKEKAEMMYSMLIKGAMPPKSEREARPQNIPTKEQIETIKKWAESLKADDK
jgi:hypothetical protein